jgi:tetratricopeptide (TPR) repeat protein
MLPYRVLPSKSSPGLASRPPQREIQPLPEALGAEHTSTLDTVNNLGSLYKNQGKMAEAEAMFLRAPQGKEKAWGPEHTSTLNTVNNLGMLYADQGNMAEAEAMYLRALQGKAKTWGAEHTSTLDTVNNLGNLYKNQGKMVEAEAMRHGSGGPTRRSDGPGLCHRLQIWWLPLCIAPPIDNHHTPRVR